MINQSINQSGRVASVDSRSNTFFKFLRAVAIIGVVYRHSSTSDAFRINSDFWSQQFFLLSYFVLSSCAVALFVFLAGYFGTSSYRKSSAIIFWKKRFTRLGTPYLFWSFVFLFLGFFVFHHVYSFGSVVKILLFGKACVPFYFFIVLFQLILLTPLLFIWAQKRTLLWLPYVISLLYLACFRGIPFCGGVTIMTLFIPWLAVYWSGMLCCLYEKEIHDWLVLRKKQLLLLTIGSYLFFFGVILYLFHVENLTTFAFRNLTVFSFVPVNLLVFVFFFYRHTVIQNRLMLLIGSYSYGIFLIHILFLRGIRSLPVFQMLEAFPVPYTLIVTAVALGGCVFTIWLGRKILGKKKAAWIGF